MFQNFNVVGIWSVVKLW